MEKRVLLALIIILLLAAAAAARTVSVAKFGARPDDGRSDTEALRRAAAYCRKHPQTTLCFPAGMYQLDDPVAIDIERRAISGALGKGLEVQWALFQPQKPYVTGLDFTGCEGLTIEARGARLQVEGWMQVLSFVGCKGVKVNGMEITYRRPAATEGRVVRTSEKDFDIEYDPALYAYIDSIVQGRYYFYSSERRHFYYGYIWDAELLRPGLVRVSSKEQPPVGDVLIIRYGGHYRPCVMLRESEDITLRDLSIRSYPGMGVVGHLCHNILIDSLNVTPEEGRFSSTSTDATHFTSCSGDLTICHSTFAGNGDDCTNIHNYYWHIMPDATDLSRIEVRVEGADLHAQALDYPLVGDTLILLNRRTMREVGCYVTRACNIDAENWRVDVTLDHPLPTADCRQLLMYNYSRFPRVQILDNVVDYNNGRAFLLKARDVVVRGNRIGRSTLSAIKLGAELSWHEAGPVEHVVVEDNEIQGAGTDRGYRATGVMVTTESPETPSHVNRNILIRNNHIEGIHPIAILLHDAQDVEIYGNTFVNGHEILQRNCCDVRLGSNSYR
ncbi:MAG: hypothetical protein J5524_11200 [Bacteroidaceae bacterium]|nr:hypothetical protein [Bacteroidaceae bacterium]